MKPLDTGCHRCLHCVKSFLCYCRSEVTQGSFPHQFPRMTLPFPMGQFNQGGTVSTQKQPQSFSLLSIIQKTTLGSTCDKCSLSLLEVPGFALQLCGLTSLQVHCCPSFHALPMALVELFISILPVPVASVEQNSQPSHKLSSVLVALLYPQHNAEFFSSSHIWLL